MRAIQFFFFFFCFPCMPLLLLFRNSLRASSALRSISVACKRSCKLTLSGLTNGQISSQARAHAGVLCASHSQPIFQMPHLFVFTPRPAPPRDALSCETFIFQRNQPLMMWCCIRRPPLPEPLSVNTALAILCFALPLYNLSLSPQKGRCPGECIIGMK